MVLHETRTRGCFRHREKHQQKTVAVNRIDRTFNRIDRTRRLNLVRTRSGDIDRYQHTARATCATAVATVRSVRGTRRRRLRRSHRVRPWNVRVFSSRLLRVVTRRVVRPSSVRRDGDARAVDDFDVARAPIDARRAGCAARQGDVRIARGGSLATSRHGVATAYRSRYA